MIGGFLVAAGLEADTSFLVFGGIALVGATLTLAVPRSPGLPEPTPAPVPVASAGSDLR